MANIPVTNVTPSGVAVTYAAAAGGGDSFSNSGNEELAIRNASGAPITATLTAVGRCSHGFLHDLAIAVAANSEVRVADIDVRRFGSTVNITYSGVTSVTVAVFRN
jgi:hypothetical protein